MYLSLYESFLSKNIHNICLYVIIHRHLSENHPVQVSEVYIIKFKYNNNKYYMNNNIIIVVRTIITGMSKVNAICLNGTMML
jgi:hypothetical protein